MSSPVLVNRERELEALVKGLQQPPSVTFIEGEAGVGKSRLIAELLASPEVARRTALMGRCHQLREPFPLGPLVEALQGVGAAAIRGRLSPVAGALRPLLPELADRLPPAPEPMGDPIAQRHLLYRAVLELLGHLGPVACVLDDLQWCDETTSELLRSMVSQMPSELSLVLAFRREDLPATSPLLGMELRAPRGVRAARVQLRLLSMEEVRQMVGAILSTDQVSADFAAYMHERTGGLPLLVEELLRLILARRELVNRDSRWMRRALAELEVPPGIRDWILERLIPLDSAARRVVAAAAVVREPATGATLLEIVGLDQITGAEALTAACAATVLIEHSPGTYGLRHSLAADALYDATAPPVRQWLHLRTAQILERLSPPPSNRLAHHYRLAGSTAEWARWAEEAAANAIQIGAYSHAASLLSDVVMAPDLSEEARARLADRFGESACRALATLHVATLTRLLERLPEPLPRGRVRHWLGFLLILSGDSAGGRRQLATALEEAGELPTLSAHLLCHLASPWSAEGSIDAHLRWAELAVATSAGGDDASRLMALLTRALVLLSAGDPQGRLALETIPAEVRTREERCALLQGLLDLAVACCLTGHHAQAQALLERSAAHVGELVYDSPEADLEIERLILRWFSGDWDGLAEEARAHSEAHASVPRRRINAELLAGLLALARGETGEAERTLRDCRGAALAAGLVPAAAAASAGLARLRLMAGDPGASVDELRSAWELVQGKGAWIWGAELVPVATEAAIGSRGVAAARELVEQFERGLVGRDAPLGTAALNLARAAVLEAEGQPGRAAAVFGDAAEAYERLPRPYDAFRARMRRGLALLAAGDDAGAGELSTCLSAFDRLGARGDAGTLRRMMRGQGVPVPHHGRGGRRRYGVQLSPQEERVVELAAGGRTNAEIARTLFLSPKTVEGHLSSAMRKLGVRSRTMMASVWRQRGGSSRAGG